jgi:predicted ATPase with chaperone activity
MMETATPVEERNGVILQPMVKLEDIPGSEIEKRALEIALAGGHSLAILYNEGCYSPQLIRAGVRLAQEITEVPVPFHGIAHPWCPCGNYGSPKVECRCSAKIIEAHLSKLGKRANDFTIWIGSSVPITPLTRYMHNKGESEAAVLKRIQAARMVPEPSDIVDTSCREMIDCYMKSVSACIDIPKVKAIAKTIARLDGQDRILIQHFAEALQYQPYTLRGFMEWVKLANPRAIEIKTGKV